MNGVRYFRQDRKDSVVHHWRWTKSQGLQVMYKDYRHLNRYFKSEYTLKELLRPGHCGERPVEVEEAP